MRVALLTSFEARTPSSRVRGPRERAAHTDRTECAIVHWNSAVEGRRAFLDGAGLAQCAARLAVHVHVRIIRPPTEDSVDGIALSSYRVGLVYALPVDLATLMIVEGWALPLDDDEPATLPAISFDVLPNGRLPGRRLMARGRYADAGLAADRPSKRRY